MQKLLDTKFNPIDMMMVVYQSYSPKEAFNLH